MRCLRERERENNLLSTHVVSLPRRSSHENGEEEEEEEDQRTHKEYTERTKN